MKINLQAKNATIETPIVSFTVEPQKFENFLQACVKEVRACSKNQKKKLQLQLLATITGLASTLQVTTAFAAQGMLISPDLIQLLVQILVTCVVIGVILSMIALVVAGIGVVFFQKEKAKTWSIDIIKGSGQIMLGPTIILCIIALLNVLLGGSGYWINPLKYLPVPVFGN